MNTRSGIFFIADIPPSDLCSLSLWPLIFNNSFLVKPLFSDFKSDSILSSFFIELEIVPQFVSIPPSHL